MPTAVVLLTLGVVWVAAQRLSPAAAHGESRRVQRVLAIEDGRGPADGDLQWLVDLARGGRDGPPPSPETRALAIRALGRLEREDLVPVLLDLLGVPETRSAAEVALVVTLRGQAAERRTADAFGRAVAAILAGPTSPVALGYLPYTTADHIALAESKLLVLAEDPRRYAVVAAAFEALARQHRRLRGLGAEAIAFLRRGVRRSLPAMDAADAFTVRTALAALTAAGAVDEDDVRAALRDSDEHVRRQALVALHAGGAAFDERSRTELLRTGLDDPSFIVRYEAVRGWGRHAAAAHGCEPLVLAIADPDTHVAIAAIQALGERCLEENAITERLASEARPPAAAGEWHRESNALVSLARRSAQRAATALPGFSAHSRALVRMYAARAAAAMKDASTLERLSVDEDDNVRDAALGPLRALKGSTSDAAIAAALGRSDYQLLRTAALLLKDAAPDRDLHRALVEAFERVTAERKDTSRDTRLALFERIREWGGREHLRLYERLTRDFDPIVANRAAEACTAFSPKPCAADPRPLPRAPMPNPGELSERVKAVVELDTGRRFELQLDRALAPLACARFSRLVQRGYYDGLTFHRVEPGFVIQGGSPGANEYAGDGPFMRDELGGSHRRGTVGISTRGRHTGDAQIFVNLADNLRLDFAYTVIGTVSDPDLPVIDGILEGAAIRRIRLVPSARP